MSHARLASIRQSSKEYQGAMRLLRSDHTTVAARREALAVRDDFEASAPNYVEEVLTLLADLISDTDGEECADPETCGGQWRCSRCSLRTLA